MYFVVHNRFAIVDGAIRIEIGRHLSELSPAKSDVKQSLLAIQSSVQHVIEKEENNQKAIFYNHSVRYISRFTKFLNSISIIDALDPESKSMHSLCVDNFQSIEIWKTSVLNDIEVLSTENADGNGKENADGNGKEYADGNGKEYDTTNEYFEQPCKQTINNIHALDYTTETFRGEYDAYVQKKNSLLTKAINNKSFDFSELTKNPLKQMHIQSLARVSIYAIHLCQTYHVETILTMEKTRDKRARNNAEKMINFCEIQAMHMFTFKINTIEVMKKYLTPCKEFQPPPIPNLLVRLQTLLQQREIEGHTNDALALAIQLIGRALQDIHDNVVGQFLDIYLYLHHKIPKYSQQIQDLENLQENFFTSFSGIQAKINDMLNPSTSIKNAKDKSAEGMHQKYTELAEFLNRNNNINYMITTFQEYLPFQKV